MNEATFDVAAGSITGPIGPNWRQKTPCSISSWLPATEQGTTTSMASVSMAAVHTPGAGLVRTFQIPRVLTRMTVLET